MRIIIACGAVLGLCGISQAAPIQWTTAEGGNNHYYDRVDTDMTWDQAKVAAEALSYYGLQGHLVTITSGAENYFITYNPGLGSGATADLLDGHWIGGYQRAGAGEPDAGWSWVTGEAFVYSNWHPGEPNDYGNENAIIFAHPYPFGAGDGKGWNDANNLNIGSGFFVEFESIPEPSTYLAGLSALGMLGLFTLRNRK